jgi:hypothetical protein
MCNCGLPRSWPQAVSCWTALRLDVSLHCSAAYMCCRFLSKGNSYLDCGHPCERHELQLRDSAGADHLVLADMGCRWGGICFSRTG